ncbi:putative ferric-chelate reductase 1 homolog [Daphnia carinata]|uniref:putative ferric-chelate reductase 1 homolog n=1 Tax=Daphnia carinata TaxID=120202 RepID=UPI002868FCF1|nr:putative ferric-chelate reductase 1 homolog [Daphnia carinata]
MPSFVMFIFCGLLMVLTFSAIDVSANPTGAPTAACESMTPNHDGAPSNTPCPFEVILNQNQIFSNSSVRVTLQPSLPSGSFKGFLVMGFDKVTDRVIGTFQIPPSYTLGKTIDCNKEYENAATHKSNDPKQSVTLDWIPPEGYDGEVIFKTTFVEEFIKYWVKQPSGIVKVVASENAAPESTTNDATNTPPPLLDVYEGCGVSKGCIATPDDCVESKNCTMMATYKKLDNDLLQLEIYGEIKGDEYVAIGFSTDSGMGSDSVVECVKYRDTLNAYQSYNTPKRDNQRLLSNLLGFVKISSPMYVDGYIYCSVQHPIVFRNTIDFDLNEPHYLLMATGPTGKDNIQEHSEEEKSGMSIDLTKDYSVSYFKDSRVLKQLHGSFMVIAWLMAASIGVLMPRYMKKTWVGKQIMKKDRWFVYHRGLMVLAWTLTVIGFIIIFIDVDGWVSESVSENPHPLIGCITTVLAFIQPFMALMRPLPNAPNRYIFNWAHMLVGYSAHILAITCIFLAVEMDEAELPYETYWILTAHICCYVGVHVLLTFLARRNADAPDEMKDGKPRLKQASFQRQIIIACYICIVVGLGSTVIAFIAGA